MQNLSHLMFLFKPETQSMDVLSEHESFWYIEIQETNIPK